MTADFLVEMKQISKRFPGVLANDCIDLQVKRGEVLALLGENGSGKSTLMSILSGLYRPDAGEIYIEGRKVNFKSPRDAIDAGIGMVHQHFKQVDTFSVAENIILGSKEKKCLLQAGKAEKEIAEISRGYGLQVEPTAKIWQLSIAERQRVEIVKMLYRGSKVLILDEPTAVLTPQEARELFQVIRQMTARGQSIILITHKLNEVMEVADRVTILRGGRAVATRERKQVNQRELARLMMGQDVVVPSQKQPGQFGEEILRLDRASAASDSRRPGLQDITLTVRQGEILGIAGIAGNGRRELAEVIAGLRPLDGGKIYICGKDVTNLSPMEIIQEGVSYIPEDRLGTGLVPNLGAVDNLILKEYRRPWLSRGPFICRRKAAQFATRLIHEVGVKVTGLDAPVKKLSGGNLQRLLLARELASSPKVIVAVYPVRGLDIAASEAVHKMLLEQRSKGAAIVLISEDLEELLKLSDNIGVLYKGSLMGVLPVEEAEPEKIGLMMLGVRPGEVLAS
ncbi:ABC transporter ATP-binding protein [Desulforamulus hydrothermalis]|uniref:Putative sugar transporter subunit: ATP-binding component of ABC superfamily n=1 Tax=Desulforamulus hydrothermalis Lam5 = DSM 18033 TaxID=1121428 RepID=K8DWW0_9FIRM|nr:ABC transporter ATP-binding protein [Desulforamulus hydrothermalis]CCO06977.1 putative sugar transporter subunit: ATP-binding component of ABC superfamily [Desulforamulus hydrothermalis Lam5 = DSM 18033]SHG98425.1 nucleoside ABC transporter ATP-binding protein [Desulforamulus hydrothermalis Lam5 = DSM 18033]